LKGKLAFAPRPINLRDPPFLPASQPVFHRFPLKPRVNDFEIVAPVCFIIEGVDVDHGMEPPFQFGSDERCDSAVTAKQEIRGPCAKAIA